MIKPKRSITLTKKEILSLQVQLEKYPTQIEAGIALGIGKDTLIRTLAFGSCSEKTYNKLFRNGQ